MKPVSLRMRLTLVTVLLITVLAGILTFTNMYNASAIFVGGNAYSGQSDLDVQDSDTAMQSTAVAVAEQASEFNSRGLILMAIVIILGGVTAYIVLGIGLRPIKTLNRQITSINANNLNTRITDFNAGDEIDSLARSFNDMLNRLEQSFDSQLRFTSAAAHELKTPLTTVKANLDILKIAKEPNKEKYQEIFHSVENQNNRMIRLVDDLFSVSMERDYDFGDSIQIGELFSDILADLDDRIKEMELSVNIENNVGSPLLCNSAMLRRAFTNLIDNAIKYNVAGGKIRIDLAEQNNIVQITISDTGVGIPAEHQDRIFEAFYRVDSSRSRKTAGSGLGLAIVKDTITRHGGTVRMHPNALLGTTFVVRLPIVK